MEISFCLLCQEFFKSLFTQMSPWDGNEYLTVERLFFHNMVNIWIKYKSENFYFIFAFCNFLLWLNFKFTAELQKWYKELTLTCQLVPTIVCIIPKKMFSVLLPTYLPIIISFSGPFENKQEMSCLVGVYFLRTGTLFYKTTLELRKQKIQCGYNIII